MTARRVPASISWLRCDAIPALVAATPMTTRTGAKPRRHQGADDSSTAASRSAAAGGTREPETAARNAESNVMTTPMKIVVASVPAVKMTGPLNASTPARSNSSWMRTTTNRPSTRPRAVAATPRMKASVRTDRTSSDRVLPIARIRASSRRRCTMEMAKVLVIISIPVSAATIVNTVSNLDKIVLSTAIRASSASAAASPQRTRTVSPDCARSARSPSTSTSGLTPGTPRTTICVATSP